MEIYSDIKENKLYSNMFQTIFDNFGVIAGGAAVSMLSEVKGDFKYPTRDVDIFILRNPYKNKEKQLEIIKRTLDINFKKISESSTGLVINYQPIKDSGFDFPVQLITHRYEDIEDLFKNFDCHLSQVLFNGDQLFYSKLARRNLEYKKVTLQLANRVFNTMQRLIKFSKLGFDVNYAIAECLRQVAIKAKSSENSKEFIDSLLEYTELAFPEDVLCKEELKLCV